MLIRKVTKADSVPVPFHRIVDAIAGATECEHVEYYTEVSGAGAVALIFADVCFDDDADAASDDGDFDVWDCLTVITWLSGDILIKPWYYVDSEDHALTLSGHGIA